MRPTLSTMLLIVILLNLEITNAQNNLLLPYGARSEGMGNTRLIQQDVWSTFNNQGGLAYVDSLSIGLQYKNQFQAANINALSAVVPALSGTFGVSFAHLGVEQYSENRLGLAYAKRLLKNLSLGVQINYHLLTFGTSYPAKYSLTSEIGLLAQVIEDGYLAVHLFNPSYSRYNDQQETQLPVIFTLGTGYNYNQQVLLTAELIKEQTRQVEARLGIEYALLQQFKIRTGIGSVGTLVSLGFGYIVNRIHIDLAISHHKWLGYSPQLSLSYSFRKKETK